MLRNILLSAALLPVMIGATECKENENVNLKIDDQMLVCEEKEQTGETLATAEDDESKQIFVLLTPEYEETIFSTNDKENDRELLAHSDDESDETSKLVASADDEESEHLAFEDSGEETKSLV